MQACPVQPQWRRPFADRLMAAVRLDATVFEEVEHDEDALGQAAGVIFLAALAQGIGGIHAPSIPALIGALVALVLAAFLAWIVSTALIWVIGVRMMGGTSGFVELLRTIAFASAPKVLLLLGVLPLGKLVYVLGFGVLLLTIVASIIAVRQALDVTTGRAILVCVLATAVSFLLAVAIGTAIGVSLGVFG